MILYFIQTTAPMSILQRIVVNSFFSGCSCRFSHISEKDEPGTRNQEAGDINGLIFFTVKGSFTLMEGFLMVLFLLIKPFSSSIYSFRHSASSLTNIGITVPIATLSVFPVIWVAAGYVLTGY